MKLSFFLKSWDKFMRFKGRLTCILQRNLWILRCGRTGWQIASSGLHWCPETFENIFLKHLLTLLPEIFENIFLEHLSTLLPETFEDIPLKQLATILIERGWCLYLSQDASDVNIIYVNCRCRLYLLVHLQFKRFKISMLCVLSTLLKPFIAIFTFVKSKAAVWGVIATSQPRQ